MALLEVENLQTHFRTPSGINRAVDGVSFHVNEGETLAIVGESGCGKSITALAVIGLLRRPLSIAAGVIRFDGREIQRLPAAEQRALRGNRIAMIFQEPMTALNPVSPVGRQIAEMFVLHKGKSWREANQLAVEALANVRVPAPERRVKDYPHQLSGGMRQRVMIAIALACDPDLLIADEPTTALDVTIQAQILDLLADLQKRFGMAIVLITHDLGVVKHVADRVVVMRRGEVVEQGSREDIFERPTADYTKMLLEAEPHGVKAPPADDAPIMLEGRNVVVDFNIGGGFLFRGTKTFRAVDNVSLTLRQGQTIGVVGESGSGKSTLGRALLRLLASDGRYRFESTDISLLDRSQMRPYRRQMQLVFQDPYGSLSPRQTVGEIITEGLYVHEPQLTKADRDKRAIAALLEVGLDPAARNRYPHEFSGGQRQRIAIARSIILKPKVIVLDEPTSALDRSVQLQVIELLRDLQAKHGLSYVFISHDLSVVRAMSDHVVVMKNGKIVEQGDTEAIFERPAEDYTKALIAAAFA